MSKNVLFFFKVMRQCLQWSEWACLHSSPQVQHRFRNGYADQPGPGGSRSLASAGGDSQPTQRSAQRGQRAARGGRESTWHRRAQPWHKPVHWWRAPGTEGCVRPLVCLQNVRGCWDNTEFASVFSDLHQKYNCNQFEGSTFWLLNLLLMWLFLYLKASKYVTILWGTNVSARYIFYKNSEPTLNPPTFFLFFFQC